MAISVDAKNAAPEDMPTNNPSLAVSIRTDLMASLSETFIISSIIPLFKISGTKPAPMPAILCLPGLPPERTGDASGSTATIKTSGHFFLNTSPTPVIVQPVPTPTTKASGT